MKFELNQLSGFWDFGYVTVQNEQPIGHSLSMVLIYNHCLIRLHLSSKHKDFYFNSYDWKSTYQDFSNVNDLVNSMSSQISTLSIVFPPPQDLWGRTKDVLLHASGV